MKIEDQVVSLELAKRLKKLGVKQHGLFSWQIDDNKIAHLNLSFMGGLNDEEYSAYAVAELGEMLPDTIIADSCCANLFIAKGTREIGKWTISYSTYHSQTIPVFTEENEANVRALLLIHLLENGYVKAEDL
jgi:hypothetical protein